MRIAIVTLFPEIFSPFLTTSMVGRAAACGALEVRLENPRAFGIGKHRSVDDAPYGGGAGMVMRVDCLVQCLENIDAHATGDPAVAAQAIDDAGATRAHRVLLSPQGAPLRQAKLMDLAARDRVTLVCGRYEGFDDRLRHFVDEEVSVGDFVLSGGEVAAMAIVDACARLLPGVLGNAASLEHESHSLALGGLLEYPQYTRPAEFRGHGIPDVLTSGNHATIAAYRVAEAERRTRERRPDLWDAVAHSRGRSEGGR
jgi:tRNA (guanine37-N1)-methyltransferase